MSDTYLFVFDPIVPLADAEETLHLAMFAVEGLAGRARVRMEVTYRVDDGRHAMRVEGTTRIAQMVARIFAGLLIREFGEEVFRIERVSAADAAHLAREEVAV